MKWDMLEESKKLFPHWLDKNEDSNFSKHLSILNHQQRDIRHKIKTVDWSRLLNKPLQINKTQTEPYKWEVEFTVNVPRLKWVNIYKNPTIKDNHIVNNYDVVNGYYHNNEFYENHSKVITDNSFDVNEEDFSYQEPSISLGDEYKNIIQGENGKYYYDLITKKYYKYEDNYMEVDENEVPQTSLIHSESFIDNYSHFFRHIVYEDITGTDIINKFIAENNFNVLNEYDIVDDKYLLTISNNENNFTLCHNISDNNYYVYNGKNFEKIRSDYIHKVDKIYCENSNDILTYYFIDENNDKILINNNHYYISSEIVGSDISSKIPLIETINTNTLKYKQIINPSNDNNGKFEWTFSKISDNYTLYYDINLKKYGVMEDGKFKEVDDDKLIWVNSDVSIETNENDEEIEISEYYYINDNDEKIIVDGNDDDYYYLFTDVASNDTVRIPLVEQEDITPIISNDKYVLEVWTWDDYHFLKGFPEIDFIDYNNNNIIDANERTYDNLNIELETINNKDYLTFRVHQFGIKLIEIFKDDSPIYIADFVIENFGYDSKQISDKFAHIYNYNDNQVYYPFLKDTDNIEEIDLDVNKYVWRYEIKDEDKIFDKNGNFVELKNNYDLKVTYYDSLHPYDSYYDKTLMKRYVCEDNIFYHDISLDVLGTFYNVPRHVFTQPQFESKEEEIDFYSKTYPTFCNTLNEDDYHYQKRLEYYINNYNKIYFPCLELWKYFHIDSELVNRKVIIAEQNYSYMKTLDADDYKYINELSKNKVESFYNNSDYEIKTEESNLEKPKFKSIITPQEYSHNRNGILVDENDNYIRDINGTLVRIDYDYYINENDEYVIKYESASRKFNWYLAERINSDYQIKLTNSLKVVPNTRYQLRFCVKEYPETDLKLRVIYKNNNGDIREVEEYVPLREDYDEINEYNELVYTNYNDEWGILCEYICTNFLTLPTAQNVEIVLESESEFQISDITLQRVTVNHLDSEYMRTTTDYNSCVYDLYADYTEIPSNIRYDNLNIFGNILNRSLPLAKKGFFNFVLNDTTESNDMKLDTQTNIYFDNWLDVESGIVSAEDEINVDTLTDNHYEHIYKFNKYVKKGEYEILFKPFYIDEYNVINDFNIEILMLVFNEDNTASKEKLILNDFKDYLEIGENGYYYRIPFMNKSDNSFEIKIYRNEPFMFKDFKLKRKLPLTMEELTV